MAAAAPAAPPASLFAELCATERATRARARGRAPAAALATDMVVVDAAPAAPALLCEAGRGPPVAKPLAGSVLLLRWKLLASPHLGGARSFLCMPPLPGVWRATMLDAGIMAH